MIDAHTYGPWALVAGGSEGVGRSFALHLARAGIDSVLVARRPGPLEETAAEVARLGARARTLPLDLTRADALARIREVTDEIDLGLLVYNAGANSYGAEFVESDPDGVQGVLDLNVTTQLALTRHVGKRLKDRGRGGLLLVGSLAGFLGQEHISAYAAAKAFGRVFAEGLWLELSPHGVDVLELVLGVTRTPAMERAGLRMDLPGLDVAEPDDVAAEGLRHLADGPVWIAGGNQRLAEANSRFPRDEIVAGRARATRRLLDRER